MHNDSLSGVMPDDSICGEYDPISKISLGLLFLKKESIIIFETLAIF